MSHGNIIFLNGPSSAGKSTLAKELQKILEQPYIHLSIDDAYLSLPQKILQREKWWTDFPLAKLAKGFHGSIESYSRSGINVIVDHCFTGDLNECIELFKDSFVVFIEMTCSAKELRKRERSREDRIIGQAESQLELFEKFRRKYAYDLQIDTSICSNRECVEKIFGILKKSGMETAFNKMRTKKSNNKGHTTAKL